MTQLSARRLLTGAIVVAIAGLAAGTAYAQADSGTHGTPKGWNYVIKDGKRVPKANRVTNADGSWREETKQGNCTTVKESSSAGEVKITRKCD
jgi:predicted RecA/RadA family phage recombinase